MKKFAILVIIAIVCFLTISFSAKADFKDMITLTSYYTMSEGTRVPVDLCTNEIGQYGIQLFIQSGAVEKTYCLAPPIIEVDK
jgi:hypothetical protein